MGDAFMHGEQGLKQRLAGLEINDGAKSTHFILPAYSPRGYSETAIKSAFLRLSADVVIPPEYPIGKGCQPRGQFIQASKEGLHVFLSLCPRDSSESLADEIGQLARGGRRSSRSHTQVAVSLSRQNFLLLGSKRSESLFMDEASTVGLRR
jgi:hypothetical protein